MICQAGPWPLSKTKPIKYKKKRDNGHLGLVRQQQEMFYGNHIFASKFTRSPDFSAIAEGFGIRTWDAGIRHSLNSDGQFFIDIRTQ